MEINEVTELVKSIKNRCEIYLLLTCPSPLRSDIEPLLPTVLEDLYQDAQEIVEGYCQVEEDGWEYYSEGIRRKRGR